MLHLQEFELWTRKKNAKQQLAVLDSCSSTAPNAELFLSMAKTCLTSGPYQNLHVAKVALERALTCLQAMPQPNYEQVALVRF